MNWFALIESSARLSARIGGLTILFSAVLIGLEVLSRNLGLGLRFHAFELTNYGFAVATALGFAHALTQRAHIRIDVVYQWLPVTLKAILDALSLCLLLILASGMSWYAWHVVSHSARLGARPNSTLDIPLALPQAIWAFGLTTFAMISLAMVVRALMRFFSDGAKAVHEDVGVPSEVPEKGIG